VLRWGAEVLRCCAGVLRWGGAVALVALVALVVPVCRLCSALSP
jgi:hypothetical protein